MKKILAIFVTCALIFTTLPMMSFAEDEIFTGATGSLELTPEILSTFEQSPPIYSGLVAEELPASVDNSTQPWFPNIGDQGNIGSCTTWATTYYQLTGTVAKEYGWDDVKTNPSHQFNPMWTYNLLNEGQNQGIYFDDAFNLLRDHGGSTYADYPTTSWLDFPTNGETWRNALKYKINYGQSNIQDPNEINTPISSFNDSDLDEIKTRINHGEILTYSTLVLAWNYIQTSDNGWIAYMRNDNDFLEGGHAMTIVGYDDTIGADINKDGIISDNEKGVFKIANSWGDSYYGGNSGFIYILYDALNSISSISPTTNVSYDNLNPSNRTAIFCPYYQPSSSYKNLNIYFTMNLKNYDYQPELTAEVTMSNSGVYNSINFDLGYSGLDKDLPQGDELKVWNSRRELRLKANAPATITYVFDCEDLINKYQIDNISQKKWYLTATAGADNVAPINIQSYKVVDNNGNSYNSGGAFPTALTASASQTYSAYYYENDQDSEVIDLGNITSPTYRTGNIQYNGDNDYFKFTLPDYGEYSIETTGSTDTLGQLFGSDETTPIGTESDNVEGLNFKIAGSFEPNTYFLRVRGNTNITGGYVLVIKKLPPPDDAINLGTLPVDTITSRDGNIDVPGDYDYYKFTAPVDGTYTIKTTGALDTKGLLCNYAGIAIAPESDNDTDQNFKITQDLNGGSTYYLRVRANANLTGVYTLVIISPPDDHGNTYDKATDLGFLSQLSCDGNIEYDGDYDYFKFTTSISGTYTMTATGWTDTMGQLYGPDGVTPIGPESDYGATINFEITQPLNGYTTYYVRVRHFPNYGGESNTGPYTFVIIPPADDHGNTYTTATDLGRSSPIYCSGNTEYGVDLDYFKYTPAVSGTYSIGFDRGSGLAQLYQLNGTELESIGTEGSYTTQELTANTTYYVQVRNAGSYSLGIVKDDYGNTFDTAADLGMLMSDTTTSENGIIELIGDIDYLKFTAPISGTYTISTTGYLSTLAQLYGSNGTSTIGAESNSITQTLTANATYYIKVRDNTSDSITSGSYTVQITSPPDDHGNIYSKATDLGTVVSYTTISRDGNIEYNGDYDYFKFTVPYDGMYTLKATGWTDTMGQLYGPDGVTPIGPESDYGMDQNFEIIQHLSANTTYYVRVRHFPSYGGDSNTGTYTLLILPPDDIGNSYSYAANLGSSDPIYWNANSEMTGDVDFFKYTPSVSKTYKIGFKSGSGFVQLYTLVGNSIESVGSESNYISQPLTANTVYYVRVRDAGSYELGILSSDDYGDSYNTATNLGMLSTLPASKDGVAELASEIDYFKFTPSVSGTYTIGNQIGSNTALITLFGSDGTSLLSSESSKVTQTLTANTTYYIRARGSYSGAYKIGIVIDDYGDTYTAAYNLGTLTATATSVNGNIEYYGDYDYIQFTPSVTGSYTISTTGADPTYARLYASNGTTTIGSESSSITASLTANTTYYLRVRDKTSDTIYTGAYIVNITKN